MRRNNFNFLVFANALQMRSRVGSQSTANQKTQLESAFESWKGYLEQVDDVLVVGIKI